MVNGGEESESSVQGKSNRSRKLREEFDAKLEAKLEEQRKVFNAQRDLDMEMMRKMLEDKLSIYNGKKKARTESCQSDRASAKEYYSQSSRGRPRRDQRERGVSKDHLGGLKLKIPTFQGTSNPDEYIDWEKKVELVFNCCDYSEEDKLKVAVAEFSDYALSWWDQVVTTKKRLGDFPITTWTLLKAVLRKRFAPRYYHSKLRGNCVDKKRVEAVKKNMETNQPSSVNQKSVDQNEDVKSCTTKKIEDELLNLPKAYRKSTKLKAKCSFSCKYAEDVCDLSFEKIDVVLENDQACEQLTSLEPVTPSSTLSFSQDPKEKSHEEIPKSVPRNITYLEQQAILVHKPITTEGYPPKHCKLNHENRAETIMFAKIYESEEKRLGLEHVKEFYVSNVVYDNMLSTLGKFAYKSDSNSIIGLNEALAKLNSLSCPSTFSKVALDFNEPKFGNMVELLKNSSHQTLQGANHTNEIMLKFMICLFQDFRELERPMKSVLNSKSRGLKDYNTLFSFSCRTYDGFFVVLVYSYKEQGSIRDKEQARAELIRWKISELEPGDAIMCHKLRRINDKLHFTKCQEVYHQSKIQAHANLLGFNTWSYLKKHLTSLEAKCTSSSSQSDFVLDKLILFKPVQPSIPEFFSKVYKEKLRTTREWLSPKAIKFKWKEKEEMDCPLTKEKIKNDHFLWPYRKKGNVRRRCQSYVICKWTNTQPHGLHHSTLIPLQSWNEIYFCFVGLSRIRMNNGFIVLIMNMSSNRLRFVSFHKTSVKLHHSHLMFEGITRLRPFLKIKLELFDVFHEIELSLSDPVFSNEISSCLSVFNFNEVSMLLKTFSNVKHSLRNNLSVSESLYECRNHVKSVLNILCYESVFKDHNELFKSSCHTFDVFALVFVKVHKRQVKDVVSNKRKRKLIFKKNGAKFKTNHEWLSHNANKFKWKTRVVANQFGFGNWKYRRKSNIMPRVDGSLKKKH